MTDSINRIDGTQGTSSGGSYSGGAAGEHVRKKASIPQTDLVEISSAARKRSAGTTSKGLLDYVWGLLRKLLS